MKELKKVKISFNVKILALSFWMIFFTTEGSFSVQILLPFLLLILFNDIFIKKNIKIKINKPAKILGLFIFILALSTIINFVRYYNYFNIHTIVGFLYFCVIFLWYLFTTNKEYSSKEIKLVINSYILMSFSCSIFLILRFLDGQKGKIAMINLINVEIDENYVSGLIAIATMYLFNKILNQKNTLKNKIINIIILIINLLAITLSGSRASLLSTICAIGLSLLLSLSKEFSLKKISQLILVIIFVIFVGIKILDYIPTWTFDRYFNSNYIDNSNTTRLLIWENSINGIFNNPILGYSIRIFENIPEFSKINGKPIPARVPAHHTYLDIMLYTGVIGIIIFFVFLFHIFKNYFKHSNKIYIPMIFIIMFISNILGAEKSVFLWNNLIILTIIGNYLEKNESKIDDLL